MRHLWRPPAVNIAWLQHVAASSPQALGAFTILMQSASLRSAEKQLQIAIWIAGVLAMVVFAMVLFSPRRKLGQQDSLGVDWDKEEARLRSLADLKKATRSPEEQKRDAATPTTFRRPEPDPVSPLPPGAIPGFDVVGSGPVATTTSADPSAKPASDETEIDKLMRGLSD